MHNPNVIKWVWWSLFLKIFFLRSTLFCLTSSVLPTFLILLIAVKLNDNGSFTIFLTKKSVSLFLVYLQQLQCNIWVYWSRLITIRCTRSRMNVLALVSPFLIIFLLIVGKNIYHVVVQLFIRLFLTFFLLFILSINFFLCAFFMLLQRDFFPQILPLILPQINPHILSHIHSLQYINLLFSKLKLLRFQLQLNRIQLHLLNLMTIHSHRIIMIMLTAPSMNTIKLQFHIIRQEIFTCQLIIYHIL